MAIDYKKIPGNKISKTPSGYSKGANLPWWGKIFLKITISRFGFIRSFVRKVGFFQHSPESVNHSRLINDLAQRWNIFQEMKGTVPQSYLEIGVGDSLARALVAYGLGAKKIWLHDAGDFATRDLLHYQSVVKEMERHGLNVSAFADCKDVESMLAICNATYLTGGLADLEKIPDQSVDMIVTDAVLEHLPNDEFKSFFHSFRRIAQNESIGFHSIDFHDHLGGKLNNLRFSKNRWEGSLFKGSGFYTNRIGKSEMYSIIKNEGFKVYEIECLQWDAIPVNPKKISKDISWNESDLISCSSKIIAIPV